MRKELEARKELDDINIEYRGRDNDKDCEEVENRANLYINVCWSHETLDKLIFYCRKIQNIKCGTEQPNCLHRF